MALSYTQVDNLNGTGPFVFVCEHASQFVPDEYGDLGLSEAERNSHIGWDPGAYDLAFHLAQRFDAPLISSKISRLVLDCNRDLDSPTLVPEKSEAAAIPANLGISADEKARRIAQIHQPFHARLSEVIEVKTSTEMSRPALVSIHSFTPVFNGNIRLTECGFLHGRSDTLARTCAELGSRDGRYVTHLNQPYSSADGVLYTIDRHGSTNGMPNVMIEVRNDLLTDHDAVVRISGWLAKIFEQALVIPSYQTESK